MTLSSRHRIRALAVWGRARYLSVTEAPHNTDFHTWMGKKHFLFSYKPPRPGTEPRTLAWKAAVLTTTLGPPPGEVEQIERERGRVALNIGQYKATQPKLIWTFYVNIIWFLIIDNHVKNKKYGNFVSISSLTVNAQQNNLKTFAVLVYGHVYIIWSY